MCTYPGLLDHNIQCHTWMFFPHGWARYGDWPDLAACRTPLPLLVQYDLEDELFRFGRILGAEPALRSALEDQGPDEGKRGLLDALLAAKVVMDWR